MQRWVPSIQQGSHYNVCLNVAITYIVQPATSAMFGLFVFVMYAGFPFTVFSQLTTGPMLDVIAPIDKVRSIPVFHWQLV